MKAAYSYTRFSSAGQIGNNSTDRQLEEGRAWYAEHIAPLGIPLDETFTDSARSAYKGEHVGKHGELGRFVAAIKSGAVANGSILIAENLDRISRQGPKEGRKLFNKIIDEGVDVHIVNLEMKLTYGWENKPENFNRVDNELHRAFKESERRSKIIKAGLKAVMHVDDWAGILPFWLQKVYEPTPPPSPDGKKVKPKYRIVEIPEKAEMVREIFRLAAQGLGAKRIMQDLDSRGIPCDIALGTVGEVLKNRAVLGEHQPLQYLETGTVPDGDPVMKFPRIIDQTLFDMVAARLNSKKKVCADGKVRPATGSHHSNVANNLFEGLLHDVTEMPERTLQFQNKGGFNNAYLISAWEPGRKSNRIRYDLFEGTFFDYLKTKVDWKAVAGEKDTEVLRQARKDLNIVLAQLDQTERLLARRTEQATNPDLPDAVVAEYYTQMANARSRIATLKEQQYRLEGLISIESAKSAALETPEKLIALITSGDPAMRMNIRTEIQRVITRIDMDFRIKSERIKIRVTYINGVTRETEMITFTKPLHSSRTRRSRIALEPPVSPVAAS
jgi:Resolvase, N terminal domain/Recombinase